MTQRNMPTTKTGKGKNVHGRKKSFVGKWIMLLFPPHNTFIRCENTCYKQEHTKYFSFALFEKASKVSFCLIISHCVVYSTTTLFGFWTAVYVYFAVLCLTQHNFSAWTDSATDSQNLWLTDSYVPCHVSCLYGRAYVSCCICVDMRGPMLTELTSFP